MMTFHKLLVIASAIQGNVHKILRTVRGAENPTGPKLPDFTLNVKMPTSVGIFNIYKQEK